ncbi:MAG: cytochrome b/b6 domain-containing protein [Gammaproteobacteria bacterium]|nr:cytochrome b/b6 domain-containing protein [Gammaproteobacteria bacterium]
MQEQKILVWDAPTRVFHWLLVASFAGAFLTAESERYRDIHVLCGYTALALLAFRLLWGFVGSRYARFASFRYGPARVGAYLRSLLSGRPEHHVGHNPAGSWAIYALILLGLLTASSGYAVFGDWGGEWLEEVHEAFANTMLAVVAVHVTGVVVGSLLHRENLARAMVTGYKSGAPEQAIRRPAWWAAALLLAAAVAFWTGAIPAPGLDGAAVRLERTASHGQHAQKWDTD